MKYAVSDLSCKNAQSFYFEEYNEGHLAASQLFWEMGISCIKFCGNFPLRSA